eukprot:9488316-Pyramimonas_sp.AAC.1
MWTLWTRSGASSALACRRAARSRQQLGQGAAAARKEAVAQVGQYLPAAFWGHAHRRGDPDLGQPPE